MLKKEIKRNSLNTQLINEIRWKIKATKLPLPLPPPRRYHRQVSFRGEGKDFLFVSRKICMLKNTYECIKTYLITFCRADLVRKICMQYCNKLFPPTKELDQGQRLNAHAVFFFYFKFGHFFVECDIKSCQIAAIFLSYFFLIDYCGKYELTHRTLSGCHFVIINCKTECKMKRILSKYSRNNNIL